MAQPVIHPRQHSSALSGGRAHHSLLEVHQVPMEFQCHSGYCGTCRQRLLAGEMK